MNHEIVARLVSIQEDEDIFILAFADGEADTGPYLLLQHSLRPDEQDVRLRQDGVYIERDDQGYGCYLGVREIRRAGNRVEIDLTESGKQALQAQHIVITPLPWDALIDRGLARLAELSRGEYNVTFDGVA